MAFATASTTIIATGISIGPTARIALLARLTFPPVQTGLTGRPASLVAEALVWPGVRIDLSERIQAPEPAEGCAWAVAAGGAFAESDTDQIEYGPGCDVRGKRGDARHESRARPYCA
ncbi:hypothetical protein G5B40_03775 [Pikeienuella piscinae]|uniref:Uncharacterized protein n=1 Tax=Pikeienuella piscinae TaxID=2748098 RepID=A0A7L5BXL8_9RHOB|nr:hypothetical protein [Pikeienuella piscinae]QIE54634.1 hypothetical protein G5B40_03775 [Pikeienuella piscinae]